MYLRWVCQCVSVSHALVQYLCCWELLLAASEHGSTMETHTFERGLAID